MEPDPAGQVMSGFIRETTGLTRSLLTCGQLSKHFGQFFTPDFVFSNCDHSIMNRHRIIIVTNEVFAGIRLSS